MHSRTAVHAAQLKLDSGSMCTATSAAPHSSWSWHCILKWWEAWYRCGECAHGDIDQDLNGNGRYDVEWYAVPCNVGDSKLSYKTVSKSHWIWAFVVANHRCLLACPAPESRFCSCKPLVVR